MSDQAKIDAALEWAEMMVDHYSDIPCDEAPPTSCDAYQAATLAAAYREQQEQLSLARQQLRATIRVLEGVTDVLDHGGFRAELVDEVITLSREQSRGAREALEKIGAKHGSGQG